MTSAAARDCSTAVACPTRAGTCTGMYCCTSVMSLALQLRQPRRRLSRVDRTVVVIGPLAPPQALRVQVDRGPVHALRLPPQAGRQADDRHEVRRRRLLEHEHRLRLLTGQQRPHTTPVELALP